MLVVCPGRGAYGPGTLGLLSGRGSAAQTMIDACDAYLCSKGQPTVTELDAEPAFRGSLHVAGEHASLLTVACSLADWAQLDASRYQVVGVTGNSMGWYTALVVSGVLALQDAIELVGTMGAYQRGNVIGGQVMVPLTGPDWARDNNLVHTVEQCLASARQAGHVVAWSIDLGSHAVLGACKPGVRYLLDHLPKSQVGSRTFPVQLPLHSAFHTTLMADTADRAARDLAHLVFHPPTVPLVNGLGTVYRPLWADPDAIRAYTLGPQLVEPYQFSFAVRTAMRYCGPQLTVALGPGQSLGGPLARIQVHDGWHGQRTRADFEAQQAKQPTLLAFGHPDQREQLVSHA